MRILTQGHLAQHMFFHLFHGLEPGEHSEHVFGMPTAEYVELRTTGKTYREIAELGGHSTKPLRAVITSMLRENRREGVARKQAWPAEADRILGRTLARIGCWLRRPLPGWDRTNPYGKNRYLHGPHKAGWPGDRGGDRGRRPPRRALRRKVTRSCWPHVAKYRLTARNLHIPRTPARAIAH